MPSLFPITVFRLRENSCRKLRNEDMTVLGMDTTSSSRSSLCHKGRICFSYQLDGVLPSVMNSAAWGR